jgi:tetratricopeptide (TPR) repeat protein
MESSPPGDSLPYIDNVWASSRSAMENTAAPSEVSAWWTDRTVRHIQDHPASFLLLLFKKTVFLFSPVAIPSNYDVYYLSRYSPVLELLVGTPGFPVSGLILWALLPGTFFAGAIRGRQWNPLLWAAVLAAGILPFFVTARFVLPVTHFAVIFLAPRFFRQPGKSLLLAPLGVIAGAGLALLTADTVRASGINMAFYDGMAHYQKGDSATAETLLLQAVEVAMERDDGVDLNGTDALYNLGVIALRRGDIEEAESYWELALERNPAFYPARRALQGLTPQFH